MDSEPISISDDEQHMDETVAPHYSQSPLEEFRRIRAEQDAEYERMLAFDNVII